MPTESESRPEIRRELTDPQGRQIWALHPEFAPIDRPEPLAGELARQLPEAARQGRRFLALEALVGLGFGALYLVLCAPLFVVKALIHVERRASLIREYDAVDAGSGYVATQAEVIQSPRLVEAAIRAIGVPPREAGGPVARAREWIRSLDPFRDGEAKVDAVAAALLETLPALAATPLLGTDVMALTYRTSDPERGVRLLAALVESYRGYLRGNETAAHREGLEVLERREAELAAKLAELAALHDARQAGIPALADDEGASGVEKSRSSSIRERCSTPSAGASTSSTSWWPSARASTRRPRARSSSRSCRAPRPRSPSSAPR